MTIRHNWSDWESGAVPRQPAPIWAGPVPEITTCDVCCGPAGDWRVIDERRWIIACPKCADAADEADPAEDYTDWAYHQWRD